MVFPKLTVIHVTQRLFLPGDWKAPAARKPWSVCGVAALKPRPLATSSPWVTMRSPAGSHEKSVAGLNSTEAENAHKISVVYPFLANSGLSDCEGSTGAALPTRPASLHGKPSAIRFFTRPVKWTIVHGIRELDLHVVLVPSESGCTADLNWYKSCLYRSTVPPSSCIHLKHYLKTSIQART